MTTPDDPTPAAREPDDPRGLALHARLVAGDVLATQELWGYLGDLVQTGLRKFMRSSPHDEDVANEYAQLAIIRLVERPERFDPSRGKSLLGFLRMDVEGDVLNYIRSPRYRTWVDSLDRPLASSGDDVGDQTLGGNIAADDPLPDEVVITRAGDETVARVRERVVKTPEDGVVFDLQYVHGERETVVFAEALGIAHLPVREQAARVQRVKDRVATRLRRMRGEGV